MIIITLLLVATCGARLHQTLHPISEEGEWESEPSGETDEVTFELRRPGQPTQEITLTGDAWRELDSNRDLDSAVADILQGADLEAALRAQLDSVENHYRCPCGQEWTDTWSCSPDDECPACGTDVAPHSSRTLAGIVEQSDGNFDFDETPEPLAEAA